MDNFKEFWTIVGILIMVWGFNILYGLKILLRKLFKWR